MGTIAKAKNTSNGTITRNVTTRIICLHRKEVPQHIGFLLADLQHVSLLFLKSYFRMSCLSMISCASYESPTLDAIWGSDVTPSSGAADLTKISAVESLDIILLP